MSFVLNILRQLSAIELSIISFVAFLLFYTMYDKTRKTLVPGNLIKVLTFAGGINSSLVEFNKAISLSGLSVLCLSFLPLFSRVHYGLLYSAMLQLWVHSAYSVYQYYGTKNIPFITSFVNVKDLPWKKMSIILGIAGQIIISAGFWNYITKPMLACLGVTFGITHFYTMEIDHKLVLRVRPFAYVVFPLAVLATLYGGIWKY